MTDEELRRAMRPMTQEEIAARQLEAAKGMRQASDEDLARRYYPGILNQERYPGSTNPGDA